MGVAEERDFASHDGTQPPGGAVWWRRRPPGGGGGLLLLPGFKGCGGGGWWWWWWWWWCARQAGPRWCGDSGQPWRWARLQPADPRKSVVCRWGRGLFKVAVDGPPTWGQPPMTENDGAGMRRQCGGGQRGEPGVAAEQTQSPARRAPGGGWRWFVLQLLSPSPPPPSLCVWWEGLWLATMNRREQGGAAQIGPG